MRPSADARPRHIVIVALDTLGDLVLRQPLFAELSERGHRVSVVVRRGYEEIVPHLDRRLAAITTTVNPYVFPAAETWAQLIALSTRIADGNPDVVVAAAHDRTYVDEWVLHQFPACEAVGFVNPSPPSILDQLPEGARPSGPRRRVLFDRLVECQTEAHDADKARALFEALTGSTMAERAPTLAVDPNTRVEAEGLVRSLGLEPGRYVFGCPAGTVNVPLKAWPAEQFVDIAVQIRDRHGLPSLLTGVPSEASALNAISEVAARRGLRMPVWIGQPGSLATLLGLIAHSRLYVGNDTGPMHCAAALGMTVVARFGGGHWPRFLPLARRAFSATRKLPCFGCAWECWLDSPACMTSIDTETLLRGVEWALASTDEERRVDLGRPFDGPLAEMFIAAGNVNRRLKTEPESKAAPDP